MMKVIIENEKLLLRELVETDVNVIFELYSDKEAMKYRGSKPFENISEAEDMLKLTAEKIKSKTEFRYAIIEKESSHLIGTYLFTPVTAEECTIGCSIGKKYWRTGYGFEVMMLMTAYLKSLGYQKLIGFIKKENTPSIRLVEKLNFVFVDQNESSVFYRYEKSFL